MQYQPTNDQTATDEYLYQRTLAAMKTLYNNGFTLCTKDKRAPLDDRAWLTNETNFPGWRSTFNVLNCKSLRPFLEAEFTERYQDNYSASGLYWGTSHWFEYQFKF